jgi:predicted nuclease of restriction endonuclease-like (RecB) superfamily
MMNFTALQSTLETLDMHFKTEAGKSVNRFLTMRNWLFGFYIVEFQQNGADRAAYGEQLLRELSKRLDSPGFSFRNLNLYRQFYMTYPQLANPIAQYLETNPIWQPVAAKLPEKQVTSIWQTVSTKLQSTDNQLVGIVQPLAAQFSPPPEKLLSSLSFSHFTFILACTTPLQRAFYEIESIKGGWSKRELKRQIESLLFERTGLSTDKEELLRRTHKAADKQTPADYFRDPYVFEFAGLPEPFLGKETDLEQALITHLQAFLLELGNGFCFEARQKRLLIGDDWHFVDLVFYHRVLKCHILIDLKTDRFKPAFAGNMNAYLNYFKEEIKSPDDQPPIGLLLCTSKNDAAVRYALGGLDEQLFVSQYKLLLPDVAMLQAFLERERGLFSENI